MVPGHRARGPALEAPPFLTQDPRPRYRPPATGPDLRPPCHPAPPIIVKRRHFLLQAASSLPCCLLPADLVRRAAAALEAGDTAGAIAAPTSSTTTLYALRECDRLLFSLGSTQRDPDPLTWREWTDLHGGDIDDSAGFREFAIDRGLLDEDETVDRLFTSPDAIVPPDLMGQYIDWGWAHTDSPQALAFHYLSVLSLGNSRSSEGEALGELSFVEGPMPGSNWTWVEADNDLILPALQHRLLELGEDVRIEVQSAG